MIKYKTHFKKGCIYKITIHDKFYIGSTLDCYGRMKHHINRLKAKKHGNPYMQNAYNKYQCFEFETLEEYEIRPTIEWILQREKEYIENLTPQYNLVKNPVSPSEEDRKRISDGVKRAYAEGRLINPWSLTGRYIDIYNLDKELLYSNILVKDAIDIIGVSNRSVINLAIRNKRLLVKNNLICPAGETLFMPS